MKEEFEHEYRRVHLSILRSIGINLKGIRESLEEIVPTLNRINENLYNLLENKR